MKLVLWQQPPALTLSPSLSDWGAKKLLAPGRKAEWLTFAACIFNAEGSEMKYVCASLRPLWGSVLVKDTVSSRHLSKEIERKRNQCVLLVLTNATHATSADAWIHMDQFSALLFPFSSFPPVQAQKLASNHTVDVSLCEVRSHSGCKTPRVYTQSLDCPTCSLSLRTINWTTRASPTPSLEVQPLAPPPPACSSQRPSLWLRCSNTCCRRSSVRTSWETGRRWENCIFPRSRDFEALDYTRHRGDLCLAFAAVWSRRDGSRLFASHASRMEMRRKWDVTTLWENTRCGSLCLRTLKGQQRCFDYRDYSVCGLFFFFVFCFSFAKVKSQFGWKDVMAAPQNGTRKRLCEKQGSRKLQSVNIFTFGCSQTGAKTSSKKEPDNFLFHTCRFEKKQTKNCCGSL